MRHLQLSRGRHSPRKFLQLAFLSAASLIAAVAAPAADAAIRIRGTPVTSVTAPTWYQFTPSAQNSTHAAYKFSIRNAPRWASFDAATGRIQGWIGSPYAGATFSGIQLSVSDGKQTAWLPAFSIRVAKVATPANTPPTITGVPSASAIVGQAYSFQPAARDAQGTALAFSIQNKPAWGVFSTATGSLTGTPKAAGAYGPVVISVSDGKASVALPGFSITVQNADKPPVISGIPATAVKVGEAYNFLPKAGDADGNTLTFSIQNKPTWVVFNSQTGQMTGRPGAADVGTVAHIAISVSDGSKSAALAPFTISVTQIATGAATLTWVPPTQNTDGTALMNLSGYKILYGTAANQLTQSMTLNNPGLTSAVIENLSSGTYYFAMEALTASGAQSDLSSTVSKAL